LPFRAGSNTLRRVGVNRSHALAALLALAALMFAGTASADAASCATGFTCATLDVPLDRSGAFPGVVHLHYAAQRRFPKNAGVLIALAGGPGQSALDFAESFTVSLEPALRRYRLVVLDQRGTGESGALVCPAVQALRTLDSIRPEAVAACAAGVGAARTFYSTADTVQDLDALRVRLGAPKIALMGVSYGTHVALSYARAFPGQVDKLILDSIVGPNGPDAFLLDTYRAFPRILREQCRGSLCSNTTRDPVADVAATVERLKAGPVRGTAFDASGKRRAVVYSSPEELSFLLIAGDLNPFLQPYIPAALSSAVRGDTAMLMRLRKPVQGGRTTLAALSAGLNVTTGCLDAPLPYPLSTPPADRPAIAAAALAQIPPSEYAPFDAATVQTSSYVDDCLLWPQDSPHPPFNGPLPDVPALLLGGRLDTRTPVENAMQTLPELPHGTLVTVRGTGHDVLDSDFSACSQTALRRFVDNQPVRSPCAGDSNQIPPLPLPPRSIDDFRSAPGVGGRRGRAVFATLDTVEEARLTAIQFALAGIDARGGGLRSGSFGLDGEVLRLRDYAFVPGIRLTGSVRITTRSPRGHVRVRGPNGTSGELDLDSRGGARGRIGGKRVRYRAPRSRSAAASSGARSLRVAGRSTPRLPRALLRARRPLR
jgi:pimeloyl-ACP methyl ester carboxylesterase